MVCDKASSVDISNLKDALALKLNLQCNNFNFWMTLAILLYPEQFLLILNNTEMNKQNPTN